MKRLAAIILLSSAVAVNAATSFVTTRAHLTSMAGLWETTGSNATVDTLISEQYPTYLTSALWQYVFRHASISSDGDLHMDLAINAAGDGSVANNIGSSPIIAEIINANSGIITQLDTDDATSANPLTVSGIFRYWTEHFSERHYELHPVTQYVTAGSVTRNLRSTIANVADGSQKALSTYTSLVNGSQTITVAVGSDNTTVTITTPSPSVNYVQYDGTATSGILSDSTSSYFNFRPSTVGANVCKVRIVSGTAAATATSGGVILNNVTLTVNVLPRMDVASINSTLAGMTASQSVTVPRPVEFILLDASNIGSLPNQMYFDSGFITDARGTGVLGGRVLPQ